MKFYLAVFAAGILVSGTVIGVELGQRLTVSADLANLPVVPPAQKAAVPKTSQEILVENQLRAAGSAVPSTTGAGTPPAATAAKTADGGEAAASKTGTVSPLPAIVLENYFGADSLQQVILKTIPNLLLSLVGLIAMIVFLVNAIRYLLSAGNADATNDAKMGMLYAVIGVGVVLLSYAIITAASQLFGS